MGKRKTDDMRELLVLSQLALPMLQVNMAPFLGVSTRTMRRWTDGGVHLGPTALVKLATAVHLKDPALAARIAAVHGETLEGLGVVRPPPPPSAAPAPAAPSAPVRDLKAERLLADALVCTAAEVADVSPRAMRPALVAALGRAREAGLVTIEAAQALFAAPPTVTKPR